MIEIIATIIFITIAIYLLNKLKKEYYNEQIQD
jgi:hypothetical protein